MPSNLYSNKPKSLWIMLISVWRRTVVNKKIDKDVIELIIPNLFFCGKLPGIFSNICLFSLKWIVSKDWCLYFQGFLPPDEVHIFGYARTKISDDELRNRLRGWDFFREKKIDILFPKISEIAKKKLWWLVTIWLATP